MSLVTAGFGYLGALVTFGMGTPVSVPIPVLPAVPAPAVPISLPKRIPVFFEISVVGTLARKLQLLVDVFGILRVKLLTARSINGVLQVMQYAVVQTYGSLLKQISLIALIYGSLRTPLVLESLAKGRKAYKRLITLLLSLMEDEEIGDSEASLGSES